MKPPPAIIVELIELTAEMEPLPVKSILAVRNMSAVAVTVFVYDHLFILAEEIRLIWLNPNAGLSNRVNYMVTRYLTGAMVIYVAYILGGQSVGLSNQDCQTFIWVFGVVGSVTLAMEQYTMVSLLYTMWDHRPKIKKVLMMVFGVHASLTTAFAILTAQKLQPFIIYLEPVHMCGITEKPWTLTVTLASLTSFNVFTIVMAYSNSLDKPYQKQAEVVTSFVNDGARMFAMIFLLSVVQLVMSIAGQAADCLATLAVVQSMYAIVASRMQLRVEALRLTKFGFTPASASAGRVFDIQVTQVHTSESDNIAQARALYARS